MANLPPERRPTVEFLDQLVFYARWWGWNGDYVEVVSFVRGLYREAGLEPPDLEPFPDPPA